MPRFATLLFVLALAPGASLWAGSPRASRPADPPARPAQKAANFASALLAPAQLAKQLKEPKASRPIVLQVGFLALYRGAHIPGALYAGPASRPEGLTALRKAAARLPRDREVVIYCGCCPLNECPNIHPAYAALRSMGFRRVRVLELPQDFAHDWVAKGLPVVRGDSPL